MVERQIPNAEVLCSIPTSEKLLTGTLNLNSNQTKNILKLIVKFIALQHNFAHFE